jgi:hypothetical protein
MPHPQFDRFQVKMKPLSARPNKVVIERDQVPLGAPPRLTELSQKQMGEVIERVKAARAAGKPVMLAHGAHTIKNCLAPVMIRLMEEGWLTHLATNGAGIIHDWEFAFQGESSEDVRGNVDRGEFGNWEETGFYLNLALNVGAYEGKGYGESLGAMIWNERLTIPSVEELRGVAAECFESDPERAAAAVELARVVRKFELKAGELKIPHPWKRFSAQAGAYRLSVPYTGHPMIGHDIIYNHAMNDCGLLGRAAQRDFLAFAHNISRIDGGVYLSIGSAVMSPMIFEKSLSISQNLHIQKGGHIDNHFIQVVDLAESRWDWTQGEPPEDNPDYYLRYNKTFNRMGGTMRYMSADNRDFLLALWQNLKK